MSVKKRTRPLHAESSIETCQDVGTIISDGHKYYEEKNNRVGISRHSLHVTTERLTSGGLN